MIERFNIPGQVAIVTGAGRGIGASIARTYAEAGADIVLAARTKEQLDAVADEVRAHGRRAHVIPCDVNENEAVEDIVAQTMAEFGRIDIVVNNAGGSMPRPLLATSAGYMAPRVRVNAIAVGSIATSALETVLDNQEIHDEMVRRTPLKRLGEPEDIALCALYLASPAASFVTGKLFEVDGGLEEANLELGLPDL